MTQDLPSDPMWAIFRAAHPEVTLVLLPDDQASEPDGKPSADPATPAVDNDTPRIPLDEVREAGVALEHKLALLAEMMRCVQVTPTSGGWQACGDVSVRRQLQLHTPATEDTPRDAALIALGLERLGWDAVVRPHPTIVWVEATTPDSFVRVTVIEESVSLRMTGDEIVVDPADAEALIGGDDV